VCHDEISGVPASHVALLAARPEVLSREKIQAA